MDSVVFLLILMFGFWNIVERLDRIAEAILKEAQQNDH